MASGLVISYDWDWTWVMFWLANLFRKIKNRQGQRKPFQLRRIDSHRIWDTQKRLPKVALLPPGPQPNRYPILNGSFPYKQSESFYTYYVFSYLNQSSLTDPDNRSPPRYYPAFSFISSTELKNCQKIARLLSNIATIPVV